MFVVSMGLALVGYTLYPTAPPRMFPEHGFVDTINDFSDVNHDSALVEDLHQPLRGGAEHALRLRADDRRHRRRGSPATGARKAFWAAWPLLVSWVVIVTGNHYWVDVALGWMVAAGRGARRPAAARPRPARGLVLAGGIDPRGRGLSALDLISGRDQLASRPMEPSAPPRAPGGRRNGRQARSAQEFRAYARDRLIESRLTPNAISVVGLVGNLVAAALVTQRLFFLAGVAFIVGSVMDTLDGRYSRMSGKGTLFGAFLDSTLDRIEEGIVLAAVAGYFAATGDDFAAAMCVVAVLGSLMVSYTRARAEALGVECKVGLATRPVRVVHTLDRPGLRQGRRARRFRAAGAGDLRDRGADHRHRDPACLACAKRALRARRRRARPTCNQSQARGVLCHPGRAEEGLRIHE